MLHEAHNADPVLSYTVCCTKDDRQTPMVLLGCSEVWKTAPRSDCLRLLSNASQRLLQRLPLC